MSGDAGADDAGWRRFLAGQFGRMFCLSFLVVTGFLELELMDLDDQLAFRFAIDGRDFGFAERFQLPVPAFLIGQIRGASDMLFEGLDLIFAGGDLLNGALIFLLELFQFVLQDGNAGIGFVEERRNGTCLRRKGIRSGDKEQIAEISFPQALLLGGVAIH